MAFTSSSVGGGGGGAGEIVLREAVDGLAGLILHRDVHNHQIGVRRERGFSGWLLRRLRLSRSRKHQERRETVNSHR
jgi:hypothetical protein